MLANKEAIWEIVKIFHPEIDELNKSKIKAYLLYDWVHIRGCGVDIGIEFECHLMSGSKPLSDFEKELRNNKFRAWRFAGDSKYKLEKEKDFDSLRALYCQLVNSVISKHQIQKPTAKQMSDYYHKD